MQTIATTAAAAQVTAINAIRDAAEANSATGAAPTAATYATAGVTGVTAANLASINDALNSAAVNGAAADTKPEVQAIVDAYAAILATANDAAGSTGNATAQTTPAPTAAQYAAIGASIGAAAGTPANLALLNDLVGATDPASVDAVAEINALAVIANKIQLTAAGGSPVPALTVADLTAAGITGVTADNLAAVIAGITAAADDGTGSDSIAELQTIATTAAAAQAAAIALIDAYAQANAVSAPAAPTGTAPTLANYTTAGVTGVTATNLAAINDALTTPSIDGATIVGTPSVQAIVDAYNKILAEANGAVADATATDPTAADYTAIGAVVTPTALTLMNDILDGKNLSDVDTVSEINALAAIANKIQLTAAGTPPTPALTLADLAAIGVTGVTPDNLSVVVAAIAAAADDGSATDTVAELQTIADTAALNVITAAAQGNTATLTTPTVANYLAAGITGATSGNLISLNSALNSASVDGAATDTVGEVLAIVNAYTAILAAADGNVSTDPLSNNNNTSLITSTQYTSVGVTGVTTAAQTSLLNSFVDGSSTASVDTVPELQALANAVAGVMTGAAAGPAPTLAQLTSLGITGVTSGNLAAVQAAIANTADDGTGVDTLAKLQALVTSSDNVAPIATLASAALLPTTTQIELEGTYVFSVDSAHTITEVGTSGAYVVTWEGTDAVNFDRSIYVQNFDASGVKVGAAIKLEATGQIAGLDQQHTIASLGTSGEYVIAWQGYDGLDESIYVQKFSATGAVSGPAFMLDDTAAIYGASYDDSLPVITAIGNTGEFVVTYRGTDTPGADYSVYAQKFNAAGAPMTSAPVLLESNERTDGWDFSQRVTAVGTGGAFVVTWQGADSAANGGDYSIYVQNFNADGSKNGSPAKLEGDSAILNKEDKEPQITAVGTAGAYAVSWEGYDGGYYNIYVQNFDATGAMSGGQIKLEAIGNSSSLDWKHQLTSLGDTAGYVVTWQGVDSVANGSDLSLYSQRFDSSGVAVGPVALIEATGVDYGIDGTQHVTPIGTSGAYAITFQGGDGQDYSVYVQTFNAFGIANGVPVKLEATGQRVGIDENPQVLAVGDSGAFVVTWNGQDSDGVLDYSVYVQNFNADGTRKGDAIKLEVETEISYADTTPKITALGTDGAFAIAWQGDTSAANGYANIYVQQFDANGQPIVAPSPITKLEATNQLFSIDQDPVSIAVGTSGARVVVWQGVDSALTGGDFSIYVQNFDTSGSPSGAPVKLEGTNQAYGLDQTPIVTAVGTAGAYVVSWQGVDSAAQGSDSSIYVQNFSAAGVPGTVHRLESSYNFGADGQHQVTALRNATGLSGEYVVTWYGVDNPGFDYSVYAQKFDVAGLPVGSPAVLEAAGNTTGFDQTPQVTAVGSAGEYVVTWQGVDSAGNGFDFSIYAQRFDSNGVATGQLYLLEAANQAGGYDASPTVTALGTSGAFVVTWQGMDSGGVDGLDFSIYSQTFDAAGMAIGSAPTKLEATGQIYGLDQGQKVTTVGALGDYVISWQGVDAQGDFSIFAQKFSANGAALSAVATLEATGQLYSIDQSQQVTAVGTTGAYVVTWQGVDSGANGSDFSIYVQNFNALGVPTTATPTKLEGTGQIYGIDTNHQVLALNAAGEYVVAWQGQDSLSSGLDYSIYVQKFSALGVPVGDAIQLEATGQKLGYDLSPQLTAVGTTGAFSVTWQGQDSLSGGLDYSIHTVNFDSTGQMIKPSVYAQSTEAGTAYLVSDTVNVSNLLSITGAADNLFNEVSLPTANTQVAMSTAGLTSGSYHLYTVDLNGNLSLQSSALHVII